MGPELLVEDEVVSKARHGKVCEGGGRACDDKEGQELAVDVVFGDPRGIHVGRQIRVICIREHDVHGCDAEMR